MPEAAPRDRAAQSLVQVDDDKVLSRILEVVSDLTPDEIMGSDAASDLDVLSTHTLAEGIEAAPDGVFWTDKGKSFEAVATIYVKLQYGSSRDSDAMSDSYPAYVYGHIANDGRPQIDRITVDTGSFYA